MAVADRAVTEDSLYGTQNEREKIYNNLIEGDIRRDMIVDTYQKYQEKFEVAANMIHQLKKRYQLNKGHEYMDIPDVEEVSHVSIYHMPESMGFDTYISVGVSKMRAATLLGEVDRLNQCTKNPLKYVHKNSKYGHLVAIPYSGTQESFSRSTRDKGWVDKIIPLFPGGKEENKVEMAK